MVGKIRSSIKRRRGKRGQRNDILDEIKLVKVQMENADLRFQMESDSDLLESAIYEMKALDAKYRYLIKSAKTIYGEDKITDGSKNGQLF